MPTAHTVAPVTEIPDHLLRRSRERRAALGQGDGEGGPGEASSLPATTGPTSAPAAAAAPAAAPVQAAPRVAAVAEPRPEAPPIPPGKAKIPLFALPVILVLPLFAFFYAHGFQTPPKEVPTDPLVLGAEVYRTAGCSGCHGANGEGGVGPVLHQGEAVKTFPTVADHIAWVKTGSAPFQGQKYGDPNRPGGQHGPATGAMPAFAGQLSDAQVAAVVQYEREKL